jgi:heat shock protein HslJ
MNKIFYFVAICFLSTGCDLSKSQSEEATTNTETANTASPTQAQPNSGTTNASSPVQNVQPQTQATTPVTSELKTKMSIYGTWVLHAFNSTIQDKTEYPGGLPYMAIDSASKKISGFAGCNGIEGTFEISGNQISISPLTKGDAKCDKKSEEAFMSFFSGKKQGFEFVQEFLYFRGADGKNFTYRKIQ